jgi:probable HAF family extracellular repeat protein
MDINNFGQVVGSARTASGQWRAFLWDRNNGMRDLLIVGQAEAINNSGQIVGNYIDQFGSTRAFAWGAEVYHTDFEVGVPAGIVATGWSAQTMESGADGSYGDHGFSGSRMFISSTKKGIHTMTLTLVGLDPHPSLDLSFLLATINENDDGDTVTVRVDGVPVFNQAIAWDASAWNPGAPIEMFTNLSLGYQDAPQGFDKGLNMGLVGPTDHALGVDFDAIPHTASTLTIDIVVNAVKPGNMYALDDFSVILNSPIAAIDIGTLGGVSASARAINDSGDVVGVSTDAAGAERAFIWDDTNGMQDLNTFLVPGSGWVLRKAHEINNLGDVVGEGTFNLYTRAFLLRN